MADRVAESEWKELDPSGVVRCVHCSRDEHGQLHVPCGQAVGRPCAYQHIETCPAKRGHRSAPRIESYDPPFDPHLDPVPEEPKPMSDETSRKEPRRQDPLLIVVTVLVLVALVYIARLDWTVARMAEAQDRNGSRVTEAVSELATRVGKLEGSAERFEKHLDQDQVLKPSDVRAAVR